MCVGFVCMTRRGMVYFGASIHIFVTFILFIGSSVRAYHLTTYEKEDSRKEILGGFIIATYFFVLLMLGCLIFRATEQKNSKLLGWTGGIFITLETFAFVVNLMILSPMGSLQDEYGFRNFGFEMNITYILLSCIFLLCMMGYCATIIMYISKLKEDGDLSSSDEGDDDDDGDEEEGSTTSNPISRTSSRAGGGGLTSIFHRSQSQSQMDNKTCGSGGGIGGGGVAGSGFNILEVVKEAKRQQQLKEQKEMREGGKQKNVKKSAQSSHNRDRDKHSKQQNQERPKPTLPMGMGGGGSREGGGGSGGGGFNILEVVREAKRQKALAEQQGKQQPKSDKPSSSQQPQAKTSSRPHTPQRQIQQSSKQETKQDQQNLEKVDEVNVKPPQQTTQGTQSDPPPILHSRPPSRHPQPSSFQMRPPFTSDPLGSVIGISSSQLTKGSGSGLSKMTKSVEQQTQTPPQLGAYPYPIPPQPHHPPQPLPLPPNIIPPYSHTQSQTLPPRRTQLMHPHPPHQHLQFDLDSQNRPYFLQEYSQRGILSAPSFASMSNTTNNTASILPHRFRSPNVGLRTTKSGTLLNRFDCLTPPPQLPSSSAGNRLQSLQRLTSSSCSSFDPMLNNANFDLDQWEQQQQSSRVQALKQPLPPLPTNPANFHYNALRRGTHRSDYGLGVEV